MVGATFACLALLLAAASINPRPIVAQEAAVADSSCTYDRCALWLDGTRLRRGTRGGLVARNGLFTPRPLLRYVTGDSAVYYAMRYEHAVKRSAILAGIGAFALVAGTIVTIARESDCPAFPFRACVGANDVTAMSLVLGGEIALLVSLPFTKRARQSHARALLWHNHQFAR
jgi:hypothetical protein